MENLLENENYKVKTRCVKCDLEYDETILGALVHTAKKTCPICMNQLEVIEVKPVRQVIME